MTTTAFRTCPLCEATCGLEITLRDGAVTRIRGDRDDVFSAGYICPKGSTLKHLHEDPDRVRTPLVRRDGALQPASWDDAFIEVERRLLPIMEQHGRDAVAIYLGNPTAHNMSGLLYARPLIKALGTHNVYSASTVDQRPKEIVNSLLFGTVNGYAVPDLDRTHFLLLLGANPFASNGSLATAPDWPGRLRRLVARGGRLVVVDPKRTQTADVATQHIAIRPGTDAHFLMAIVNVMFADGLVRLSAAAEFINGLDAVAIAAKAFPPEAVAGVCGVDAPVIRQLAHEFAAAESAVAYGRIGTCTQEFGTLASWLVDVINVISGNLDRPGGAMFTLPAHGGLNYGGTPRVGRATKLGRFRSRVRGAPETLGELPASCLAEEIDTPGDGQVRALVTLAGNPALSTPDGARLANALASLEFMVSIDIYVNETTRHADVIFPAPSALCRGHYDFGFYQFALRNIANYSPPVFPLEPGALDEWQTLAKLTLIAQGAGAAADPSLVDDALAAALARRAGDDAAAATLLDEVAPRTGPERLLDLQLRTGPYGLTLDDLLAAPHGIDLGELQPRLPDVLRTPTGMIELAPEPIVDDVARLEASLERTIDRGRLVLIGRRHLRSNNSWMHNIPVLVKGKPRCTLEMHPEDAALEGLGDGDTAVITSATGSVTAPVALSDRMLRGVVSLPHGWGHDADGAIMTTAAAYAGVNSNALADATMVDPLSGNAVLNGIPVTVSRPVRSGA